MKSRFFFSSLLLSLLFGLTTMSCSKDDDDDDDKGGSIEGYWLRDNTKDTDERFHYFEFTNTHFRRVIIEQDKKTGDIIGKETDEGTVQITGDQLIMKGGSGIETTYKFSADQHHLTLKMINPSSGDVIATTRMSRITGPMFNQVWNAKEVEPLSIHKQWLTYEVGTVDPEFAGLFSGLVLDLTDEKTGYMMLSSAKDMSTYKKGHWYVAQSENYWVNPSTSTTGKIGFCIMEYEYKLSETDLELTLVSKGLTAHYTAVKDIEDDGPIDL